MNSRDFIFNKKISLKIKLQNLLTSVFGGEGAERHPCILIRERNKTYYILYPGRHAQKEYRNRRKYTRNATLLLCIIIEFSTFLSCRYAACRQSSSRHFDTSSLLMTLNSFSVKSNVDLHLKKY
jgi:hypothetical protein